MLTKTIQLFTEKEEEFVNLLIEIGTRRNVAKMLVYLANIKEATSREIERGTDLRQPEVSIAIKYLEEQGWIKSWKTPSDKKGRPVWNYALAVPVRTSWPASRSRKKPRPIISLPSLRRCEVTSDCTGGKYPISGLSLNFPLFLKPPSEKSTFIIAFRWPFRAPDGVK